MKDKHQFFYILWGASGPEIYRCPFFPNCVLQFFYWIWLRQRSMGLSRSRILQINPSLLILWSWSVSSTPLQLLGSCIGTAWVLILCFVAVYFSILSYTACRINIQGNSSAFPTLETPKAIDESPLIIISLHHRCFGGVLKTESRTPSKIQPFGSLR